MSHSTTDALYDQAGSDPQSALDQALTLMPDATGEDRVGLLHALGLAHRNLRDPKLSADVLKQALEEAERLGADDDRQWAIRADLAVSLADSGDMRVALTRIGGLDGPPESDVGQLGRRVQGRLHHIRGLILQRSGYSDAARQCYDRALTIYREVDNRTGLGHVLGNLGILETYEGDVARAVELFDQAIEAFDISGQHLWVGIMTLNKGWALGCAGHLAQSLRVLADAEQLLNELDFPGGLRAMSRAEVLLKAGLYATARQELASALEEFESRGLAMDRAETLLLAVQAAELDGDLDAAMNYSSEMLDQLNEQARPGWTAAARAIAFGVHCRAGSSIGSVTDEAVSLSRLLADAGHRALIPGVRLSAAWVLIDQGRLPEATKLVDDARASCQTPELRSMLALTEARLLELSGRQVEALETLDIGFRYLEEEIQLLGGVDIAAMAATTLVRIVEAAKRLLAPTDATEAFLRWADRGRQTASWRWPRLEDPEIARLLNQLRALSSADEPPDDARIQTREQLREQIRELRWQQEVRAAVGTAPTDEEPADGIDQPMIDLVRADDRWYIITSGIGAAAEHFPAELDASAMAGAVRLARVFHSSPPHIQRQLMVQLGVLLEPLDRLLAKHLPDDPDRDILIGTDEALSDIPWTVLPCLWERSFSILPTHRYLRGRTDRISTADTVSILVGPGLVSGGAETQSQAQASIQWADTSTFDRLGEAMDARVVHIAAHGGPEPDNPLFNWLEFDFGRTFLHDLMFLDSVPETVVLAACYAGQTQRLGAGGTASFANGFLGIGSRWVISASTALADDPDLVSFAQDVLHRIVNGQSPPRALAAARSTTQEPRSSPAAVAFTCYGG